MSSTTAPAFIQTSLDDLDETLQQTTFTVVDLETTGGRAGTDAITEFGAVRVRGGVVLGEFQSLVDPGIGISPFVSVLTGITDSMVIGAPPAGEVLLSFLEFARGSTLVAHNAPFDVGFLRAAADAGQIPWPAFPVLDTAVLARRVLTRDEVPNCKLSTLAAYFHATTTPVHRALADARATVDVLHGLIARLGNIGVQTLPDLKAFTSKVSDAQRRKRHLADGLPTSPGVYIFRDERGEPLYVGTSRNIRSRVRQYFLASETRSRMGEMVGLAARVDPVECSHPLEAQVRELRLIAAHKPRYNRRSKFPERQVWLKLTEEAYPRLSIVREVSDDNARYLGPLRTQRQAEAIRDAIHDAVPLRQCSDRLSLRRRVRAACTLAGIGRCCAPCEGEVSPAGYAELADLVALAWSGDARPLIEPLQLKVEQLSTAQRYEHAGVVRDRMAIVVRACARMQRIGSLTRIEQLVAAAPDGSGGWELCVVSHGRLTAAGVAVRGRSPWEVIEALLTNAEAVRPGPGPLPAALAEETECVLRWLEQPLTRLVQTSQAWSHPAFGAGSLTLAGYANEGQANDRRRREMDPFADRRRLPLLSRPAR
ncbi:DEDD exonuclease domain-containing protein [Jatrophihabitans sp. GAS493]|uniref:DEDD exonuclease domain-containing protein n=1 Tax=Jatrophihabitans sp. GAS493 TaxID=1907575 RepID=UPI001560836D|nr:DEDD exonuclease domain-containing protein [Jatrophihabitans sp. GAS493]